MTPDAGLAAWLRLAGVPGLGPRTMRRLLGELGLPEAVLGASHATLARIVGEALAARVQAKGDEAGIAAGLDWAAQDGNAVITLADAEYPPQLLEIADPPPLLYVRGDPRLLARRALAIVGARNATPQGLANAQNFARAFSQAGLTIVSGLALGVDAAAHRGALDGEGSTIAVLGTGVDLAYPARNAALYERIGASGALVSELPLGTPALAANFPRRNRLISGLAHGVLVVEAAVSSGSLITARTAAEQGRDVFAVPGSIHSPMAKGCHALIKQGAKLVESAADVLDELGVLTARPGTTIGSAIESDGPAGALLALLGHEACDVDTLAERAGLTPAEVSSMLLTLELDGRVASLPGGRVQRLF
jgi:DNA processing protein